jgi:Fe2+ transport system protein B
MTLFYIFAAVIAACLATAALMSQTRKGWIWLNAIAGLILAVSLGIFEAIKAAKKKLGLS